LEVLEATGAAPPAVEGESLACAKQVSPAILHSVVRRNYIDI
jgi:hypothetical protein